jgi:signal transduction histidine kinase
MAEAQGGTLTVASELNSGSTFTLTLPLADAAVRA